MSAVLWDVNANASYYGEPQHSSRPSHREGHIIEGQVSYTSVYLWESHFGISSFPSLPWFLAYLWNRHLNKDGITEGCRCRIDLTKVEEKIYLCYWEASPELEIFSFSVPLLLPPLLPPPPRKKGTCLVILKVNQAGNLGHPWEKQHSLFHPTWSN